MPFLAHAETSVGLVLLARCPDPSIAAPSVAKHLGLTLADATARLSALPSTLGHGVERETAQRLKTLLGVMGVEVELTLPGQERSAGLWDLALQPVRGNAIPALAGQVGAALRPRVRGLPSDIAGALAAQGGLSLAGLTGEAVHAIRRALCATADLRVVAAPMAGARFDVLTRQPPSRPLARHVARLGLTPCHHTGALASGIDRATCRHLATRFPDAGLVPLHRSFQRFDIDLVRSDRMTPRELADFLAPRTAVPRQAIERLEAPIPIDRGLSRSDMLEFLADYAALGLETRARLQPSFPLP